MTEVTIVLSLGMALVFALSGLMKLISPRSVAPLLDAVAPRLSPFPVALGVGALELGCAVGIALAWRWAWLVAAVLLLAFSSALALAVRYGLRPRCGCLGDLTDSPVAGAHVGRNMLMLVVLALTAGAPSDRPLAAVPGACVVAALLVLLPDGVALVRDLRGAVAEEIGPSTKERAG